MDATTAHRNAAVPAIAGPITAAMPDGLGGWHLGIQESSFRTTTVRLAHLRADKTLDPNWHPTLDGRSPVVLALAANNTTVYTGGQFKAVNGVVRPNVAAVDAVTGVLKRWVPDPGSGIFSITALAATDTTVYVGGSFQHIGGQSRSQRAALDATTGLATAWNPQADGAVKVLAASGATELYFITL